MKKKGLNLVVVFYIKGLVGEEQSVVLGGCEMDGNVQMPEKVEHWHIINFNMILEGNIKNRKKTPKD